MCNNQCRITVNFGLVEHLDVSEVSIAIYEKGLSKYFDSPFSLRRRILFISLRQNTCK